MITVSVCMIVKNEENVLARCLDSLTSIADEIVIVDTGSTDATKEIAAKYTDKIYDFEWIQDFSAARNFAFSKCSMDYIYSADADEVLDEENQKQFQILKEVMDPQVEIVQMYYGNQLDCGSVYNFDKEYRPKLFKRLREFVWEEPVHEAVRLTPVVFDSDIVIQHLPEDNHSGRDFGIFLKTFARDGKLSKKMLTMYARELFVSGTDEDFVEAIPVVLSALSNEMLSADLQKALEAVLVKGYRIDGKVNEFFTMALHNAADGNACAEVCYELGLYYESIGMDQEALIWYMNAAFETESQCDIHKSGDLPLDKLAEVFARLGDMDAAKDFEEKAKAWKIVE